ncbi:hypothetical protein HK096_002395 [Nowakowskiella sp. JEL0078]|nr:hypothetical protein HK096_002395 [Nowakowskiella sp. JEL0078]
MHQKKQKNPEQLAERKEILDLCTKHIEECESLEKRQFNENFSHDRVELLTRQGGGGDIRNRKVGVVIADDDSFMKSELPDIDVEEDLKKIDERNKLMDDELKDIGLGVGRLKEIANEMNNELSHQNELIHDIDKNVEDVLDHLDTVNLKMKKAVEKV